MFRDLVEAAKSCDGRLFLSHTPQRPDGLGTPDEVAGQLEQCYVAKNHWAQACFNLWPDQSNAMFPVTHMIKWSNGSVLYLGGVEAASYCRMGDGECCNPLVTAVVWDCRGDDTIVVRGRATNRAQYPRHVATRRFVINRWMVLQFRSRQEEVAGMRDMGLWLDTVIEDVTVPCGQVMLVHCTFPWFRM